MDVNKDDTIEIDLLALARAVWKRIWAVIAAVVIGAGSAFCIAQFLVTPLYEAKAMLYVNNSSISVGNTSFSISSGELTAAQSLVRTYIVILKSRQVLNTIIDQASLPYTYEELEEMVDAEAVDNTEIFEVVITDADPEEAELIANTIANVLPDKIADIVEGSSVRIVDYAVVPAYPVSPSVIKYTLVGFLLGGVLSVGVIILLELINDTIQSEDYLIQTYELPILAAVPSMESRSGRSGHQPASRSAAKGGED